MVTASIRPSTVDGIKQLAKKLRRERNITHTEALEDASRQAGYENFLHAKRRLARAIDTRCYPVFLSIHWRTRRGDEPTPDGLRAGRELFRLDLARPLQEIIAKHRVSRARGLGGFRMEYDDHLEHLTNVEGQEAARQKLLAAARSLRFMETTGLQPISNKKHRSEIRKLGKIPGEDHASEWFDPAANSYMLLDEPYDTAIEHIIDERQRWIERHNFKILSPKWEGIYFPGACPPHLISSDAQFLERIASALMKLKPIGTPEIWPYRTGLCDEDFISPKREADHKPRKPRPGPSWRDHKGATPYGGAPGIRSKWRPSKPMPFEMHQQLGRLFQQIGGGFSWEVGRKLDNAQSLLEDWSMLEHGHQHKAAVYDLYYGGSSKSVYRTDSERLNTLTEARAIVERGYDDCKPRRELMNALDAAIAEIKKESNQLKLSSPEKSATR